MDIENLSGISAAIKYPCYVVIVGGLIYVLYNRSKPKVVSLKTITEWANENKEIGKELFLSRLSILPKDVYTSVRKEIGLKYLINGYKDNTSILATIVDSKKNVVKSFCFLGTVLDEDLENSLGEKGLNIKL